MGMGPARTPEAEKGAPATWLHLSTVVPFREPPLVHYAGSIACKESRENKSSEKTKEETE